MINNSIRLNNLNGHLSYVFALVYHNIIYVREGQPEERITIQYLVTGGADKKIILWDLSNMQQQELNQMTDKWRQGEHLNQINKQIELSQDQLNFGNLVLPEQFNNQEFVNCLESCIINEQDTQQSYLFAGYESNEIVRFNCNGRFRINENGNIKINNINWDYLRLLSHNDSVRSLLFQNGYLYSSGDDMCVMQQTVNGILISKFFFESIVNQLYKFPDNNILFLHQSIRQNQDQNYIIITYFEILGMNNNGYTSKRFEIRVEQQIEPFNTIDIAYDNENMITNLIPINNRMILFTRRNIIHIFQILNNNFEILNQNYYHQNGINLNIQNLQVSKMINESYIIKQLNFQNTSDISAATYHNQVLYIVCKRNNGQNATLFTFYCNDQFQFDQIQIRNDLEITYFAETDKNTQDPYEVSLDKLLLFTQNNRNTLFVIGDALRYFNI